MPRSDLLRPHPQASLDDTLELLQPRSKKLLRTAFAALTQLDETKRALIDRVITASVRQGFDAEDFARQTSLTKEQAHLLANASTFLAALVTAFAEVRTSDLVQKLAKHDLLLESDQGKIADWLEYLRGHRNRLQEEFESSAVANQILPSLLTFEVAIDIRLAEAESDGPIAIPVAVAVLDTDAEGQAVWFQMSKAQLLRLQAQLGTALKQFERAEQIAQKVDR